MKTFGEYLVQENYVSSVDVRNAKDSLKDEDEAISKYTKQIAQTSCPKLKAVLKKNLQDEKEHKAELEQWLAEYGSKE